MRRWQIVTAVAWSATLALTACSDAGPGTDADAPTRLPTQGSAASSNGRIVFQRYDPSIDAPVTYTVNPDGGDLRPLFEDGHSEMARWSPDGTLVHIFCCSDGMVAHLIDPETGEVRGLPAPNDTLELYCGGAWSPDGERLACEAYGEADAKLSGVYSVLSSNGSRLTQITSNTSPQGWDTPGDFSPDGTQLVFARFASEERGRLFVIDVDGTGMHRISGRLVGDVSPGRWSPTGDRILFAARRSEDHHKTIWIVNADGSMLRELPIDPRCGGLWANPEAVGCYSPAWSPDGTRIVYVRSTPAGEDAGIFVADADGSGSVRVTDGEDDQPDWGMPPG